MNFCVLRFRDSELTQAEFFDTEDVKMDAKSFYVHEQGVQSNHIGIYSTCCLNPNSL